MDKYENFAALSQHEKHGVDFIIKSHPRHSHWAIIAPHGGEIEFGTSELAEAIAGDSFSFYAFEGIKKENDFKDLHITSTNFDEPEGLKIVGSAHRVLTLHGERSSEEKIFLGGLDEKSIAHIKAALEYEKFVTDIHPKFQGRNTSNICNKGTLGIGVQLELSAGLRLKLLSSPDRKETTPLFHKLVKTLVTSIHTLSAEAP